MSQTAASHPATALEQLAAIRSVGGERWTNGLPLAVIERFLGAGTGLACAIGLAHERLAEWRAAYPELVDADERDQIEALQHGIVNFYGSDLRNPYVALGAAGPWIVTTKGAVIHDAGGYGMLGQGHTPAAVLEALRRPQAMANVMTPNLSQRRIMDALRAEIGHTRTDGCPFPGFLFMNSGSESVSVAARIVDMNAKQMTDPGGRHAGKPIRRLALRGGFHGRTQRPAMYSDSGFKTYAAHLATFRDSEPVHTVAVNDLDGLRAAFAQAEADGVFIEALFMEPVMGEGNPGIAVARPFYDLARELTEAHGAFLFVDSIQAGLRATGMLSLVDYPGFEDCAPPDLETYSKALNAGQYPLSVLAVGCKAHGLFRPGIYGNTMTAAPRAMDVGTAVLEGLTDDLRANIRDRGVELVERLEALAAESGGAITDVTGTGLLVAAHLDPARYRVHGPDSVETYMRTKGIGVIHGGTNALRFTPHFAVSSDELALLVDAVRDALANGPTLS